MRTRKKPASKLPSPAYPLPPEVILTPQAQEDWARLTRLLPFNRGPRLLFVLVDSPVLRRRLLDHLVTAFASNGHEVARLELQTASYQPLQDIFAMVEAHPQARFFFLHGLERSLISPEHRLSALADLNLHRDQMSTRLACPLVIWTADDTLTDLARHTPDFIAWQSGIFTLADPTAAVEAPYRQHLIDRFSKLTLYSATSDVPLAVDLERVFVKLTAIQHTNLLQRFGRMKRWAPAADIDVSEGWSSLAARIFRSPDHAIMEEIPLTLSLAEVLQRNPYLAVIGAPGAGKTTLLRFLALTFARRQALERLDLEEERLPLFVTLRDFSRFLDDIMPDNTAEYCSPDMLPRFLTTQMQQIAPHLSLPDDFFHDCLAHGRCIVLLDGLDEVADPHKRAWVTEVVATCTRHYQGNRFVVTSRPRGYEGEAQHQLAGLYASCTIRNFDDADMTAFAQHWYTAVIRNRMGDIPEALAEARRQADDLLRAIRTDERVQTLAHNPLLLSVLAMVHQRGVGLPQRRTELYDECTDMLLGYWDYTKGGEAARELATYGALTRGEKRALLEPVALWFHERGAQGLEATQEELEREIARQFIELGDDAERARRRAALFVQVIEDRAGLLVERETGVYAFGHLTLQEYLAAQAIADRDDYVAYTLQRLHVSWWREVLLLEVGHLSDVRHYGRRARRLTSDLLHAICTAGSWLEAVLKRDFLLAVRCLCDTSRLSVDDDLRTSLLDELIALWHTTPYTPQWQEVVALFAYAMRTVDGPRIHAELLRCLTEEDRSSQLQALRALQQIGAVAATADILQHLLTLLSDADMSICGAAAGALGQMDATGVIVEALPRLLALITNGRLDAQYMAARALGKIGADTVAAEVIPQLLTLATSADSIARQGAAMALEWMDATTVVSEAVPRLLILTTDRDENIRRMAVETLRHIGENGATVKALRRLFALTADTDQKVRCEAIWALGRMGAAAGAEVVTHLLMLTHDMDHNVRAVAIGALGWLGVVTAEVVLRLLDLSVDANEGVRFAAQGALLQLHIGAVGATAEVMQRLLTLTTGIDETLRYIAVKALGHTGAAGATAEVVQQLLALTTSAGKSLRSAATEALGSMGANVASPEVMTRLLALSTDADEDVRRVAAWALGQMDELSEDVLDMLAAFWQCQLSDTEHRIVGDQYEQGRDIAYEQLQQLARYAASRGKR